MNIVKTVQGPNELCETVPAQLRALRDLMPLGAVQYVPPESGANFGLVMKCGEQETWAVKQQPVEVPKDQAMDYFAANVIYPEPG